MFFPKEDNKLRLVPGDELRLRYSGDVAHPVWQSVGHMAYLQWLMALEKEPLFQHVAVRCICSLLNANPHFNYRESLLEATVRNISSMNEAISKKLCCSTIKSLFTNEGKHGGEATGEAERLITDNVKVYDCQLHPDSIFSISKYPTCCVLRLYNLIHQLARHGRGEVRPGLLWGYLLRLTFHVSVLVEALFGLQRD